jgi:hypothetical protein
MPRSQKITMTVVGLILGLALLATGCSVGKATEPFRDAPRGTTNSAPMDIIEMSDGFSNLGSKCDGENRVYVVYHGDSLYGSVAVVPNDPRCTGPR